jgi:hypothetical protein
MASLILSALERSATLQFLPILGIRGEIQTVFALIFSPTPTCRSRELSNCLFDCSVKYVWSLNPARWSATQYCSSSVGSTSWARPSESGRGKPVFRVAFGKWPSAIEVVPLALCSRLRTIVLDATRGREAGRHTGSVITRSASRACGNRCAGRTLFTDCRNVAPAVSRRRCIENELDEAFAGSSDGGGSARAN